MTTPGRIPGWLPPHLRSTAEAMNQAAKACDAAQRYGVLLAADYVSARSAAEVPGFDQILFDSIVRNGGAL